jgi:methylenetetrahydrofolate reductase (NADPH)
MSVYFEFTQALSIEAIDSNVMPQASAVSITQNTDANKTFSASKHLATVSQQRIMPHLAASRLTKIELDALMEQYSAIGIKDFVVIRGDDPSSATDFTDSISLLKYLQTHAPAHNHYCVAAYPDGHPLSSSPKQELTHFKAKVEAGADSAISQFFYQAESYAKLLDNCAANNIDVSVTPGIMPFTHLTQLQHIAKRCQVKLPRSLEQQFEKYADDPQSSQQLALELVLQLCEDLQRLGAPGFYFYTLNDLSLSLKIVELLSLK